MENMFATHVSNDLYLKLKHALTHALASYEGIKKTNSPIRERVVQALPPNGLSPGPVCVWGGQGAAPTRRDANGNLRESPLCPHQTGSEHSAATPKAAGLTTPCGTKVWGSRTSHRLPMSVPTGATTWGNWQ